ncbi:MAG TPA: ComEC/Rec2 family competence protein [Fimbriimonadaceae bacterium]|nr:ComEC/Rec2 family competence protein [Fimbriimonadaceae bacterium]
MFARLSTYAALLVALAAGAFIGVRDHKNGTYVVFLSVGQGDCTLLMSDDWAVLVDTGPRTEDFDAGARLVVPQLRKFGVHKIDCVLLTHPDMDHIGGLKAIADRYRIGKVLINGAFRRHILLGQELEHAGIASGQITWLHDTETATLGALRLTIASPPWHAGENDNDGSLFVRADAGRGSVMITGDANSDVEHAMSLIGDDWDVQILKAGHHGSKTSTSEEFLEETSPQAVIVSCGRRNRYGHPAKETVARIKDYGAQLLRTDTDGTIVYALSTSGFVRARY